MIKELILYGLYGNFNYHIKFKDEGVTILTGPNGFGKSTILKIINSLNEANFYFFINLVFKKIEIINSDGTNLIIEKENEKLYINKKELNLKRFYNEINSYKRRFRVFRHNDENKWFDRSIDKTIDIEEWIEDNYEDLMEKLYNEDELNKDEISRKNKSTISLLQAKELLQEASGKVRFIKEQRLITEKKVSRHEKQFVNTIDELPQKFKLIMSEVSNKYSSVANELDSTYPRRLFNTKSGITKVEYENKINSINEKFEKLDKFDISDFKQPLDVGYEEQHAKALKIYIEDFEHKYEVFHEFIEQLEMFTEIINSRLKFNKVRVSRENGIEVYQKKDKDEGLKLNQLSSGEKQEIVLFYDLIFNIEKGVHLLIDEPEISLHIEWQLKFMDDLMKIAKKKNLRVTVATHSPQIINNHWDLQIDLGELYE